MQDTSLQQVKGVVRLHYLKFLFSRCFGQQRKTSVPKPMEEANHMMSRIQDGNIVLASPLPGGLRTAKGVVSLSQLVNPVLIHKPPGGGTVDSNNHCLKSRWNDSARHDLGRGRNPRESLSVASQLSLATLEAMLKQVKGGNDGKIPTVCLGSRDNIFFRFPCFFF